MTKKPPRDRYPTCHPSVLSCKQQTIALRTVHDVSKIHDQEDINLTVLPLVAAAHARPYTFLSLEHRHKRGHKPSI